MLPIVLTPGEPVDITVRYLNTIYVNDPDSPDYPDIDGCTLFLFLLPFDMAVDANRDGEVKMGSSSDSTTQQKPFAFWVNDDFDRDDDEKPSGTPDWNDGLIQCARDLEDFSRIKISVGGLRDAFQQGKFKIGFEWKQTTGSPAVQVYPLVQESASEGYLKDEQTAAAQIEPGVATGRWAFVAGGGRTQIGTGQAKVFAALPSSIATRDFENDGIIHLLFEGCGEGKGQLCITIHDENGAKMADGPGVWLDLKDVRKMYQRSYGKPRDAAFHGRNRTNTTRIKSRLSPMRHWIKSPSSNRRMKHPRRLCWCMAFTAWAPSRKARR